MKQRIGWTFISFFLVLMLLAWSLPAKTATPAAPTASASVTLLDVSVIGVRLRVDYQYIP